MQIVTVGTNQAGQRLDKFLHKVLPEAGNSFLYKMLRKKNITLNGKKAEGKEMLAVGDEIKFFFSDETYTKFAGMAAIDKNNTVANTKNPTDTIQEYSCAYKNLHGISILYEDDNVVMLNKPVGILTQKANPSDLSLNEWLIGYLLEENAITEDELRTFHPSVCNRLDRNTSGIVLCGKSLAGSQELSRVIKDRSIRKFYYTVCVGKITEDAVIDGYLYKDEKTNKVTVMRELPSLDCSPIRTAYHPLAISNSYTLLEVELITGKTHQIRSHLASIGHPIIGDGKYGNRKCNLKFREEYSLQNQLLHAHHVTFGEEEGVLAPLCRNTFTASCPKLFSKISRELFPNYESCEIHANTKVSR